jgi:hypothetical protein
MEAAGMEGAPMEPAAMEPTSMEPTSMEPTSMEPTTSVKPAASAMRSSVGQACLTHYSRQQQSSCGSSQNPSLFGLNLFFA